MPSSTRRARSSSRSDRLEGSGLLAEIERLAHVVRGGVAGAERLQPEESFNELQDRGVVVRLAVYVSPLRVGRDYEAGHSEPVAVGVNLRRRHMIVPTSVVVPGHVGRQ